MQKVTSNIELSKDLSEKIVIAKPEFKFYFDKDKNITVSLRVSYDKYEFDYFEGYFEKVIYRDTLKEESVVKELYKLGFENANNSFVLLKDDDYIFQFFKKDILSLQKIGEVYYSESFTGIKSISKGSFKGDIRKGKYNYFELNFSIKGLENEEILSILKAFRDNKKYYNNVDLVNYSNVKDLTDFLNKMREEILNEKNDEEIIRGREILKKIIYKVEPEFNKYSDLDKEKISELLYWLYEELSSRIGISQEEKFEWNTMGIKLFRLKKYKKYWEPRGIRYRI